MRKLVLVALCAIIGSVAFGQQTSGVGNPNSLSPVPSCVDFKSYVDVGSGLTYAAKGSPCTWQAVGVQYVTVAPSGACTAAPPIQIVSSTGVPYTCNNGTWGAAGGGSSAPSVTVSTSGPVTVTTAGYYFNNAAGALTFTLKTLASGDIGSTWCFRNYTTKTGAITLTAPASTFIDVLGANGSAAGTLVSAGAAGDSVCLVAVTTTEYMAYIGAGIWTNN